MASDEEIAVTGRRTPRLGRGRAAHLLATVFVSGAAVMIVEMTAVRAVQPFFGSTTYVWTHVIAVVLAALALVGGLWALALLGAGLALRGGSRRGWRGRRGPGPSL